MDYRHTIVVVVVAAAGVVVVLVRSTFTKGIISEHRMKLVKFA